MPTLLVTGASRGLGFAFLKELSADRENLVVGLARNKPSTERKIVEELGSAANVLIVEADITNYDALKKSVQEVSKITSGTLDYIIANAALIPSWSAWDAVDVLVNVAGNIHIFNLYMPLVLKGRAKKVIAISSGMSDIEVIRQFDIEPAAPYAVRKTGLNVIVAKFAARYAKDGVLFMSICPGSVNTGFEGEMTEEQTQKALHLASKFVDYAPNFHGPTWLLTHLTPCRVIMASSEPYEVIVLGATGWTATICAEHIVKTFPTTTRWCIAGRPADKLERLRQSLKDIDSDRLEPTIHIVPRLDSDRLDSLICNTKVLINGIGPYHRYGTPVVESRARNGTHYVDFSTETAWIADMIRDYHNLAEKSGAIIIPAISGSSSPSDLVAWLLVNHLHDYGLPAPSEVRSAGFDTHTYGRDFTFREYTPTSGFFSAAIVHIVTKVGILLFSIPWFRSFVRGKAFDPGSGPDREESRRTESAEWKATAYVNGNKEPVAVAGFGYEGALVDMAAILAVEAAAAIMEATKVKADASTTSGFQTPSILGLRFVDRLKNGGFTLSVHGL
ncbi:hypothetical protein CEP54_006461 [Fusarium duplospermum]|uniref:Saccharopine dehydrogenase NADP binding domain-containing protein n=1 Tax=Fusarium duplospermum TaxID=1325734 RepID=A0A428Q6V9_9HYPO|nr:hypothetical protein CEP54_006461 [Fusarium duplospermum]